MSNGNTTTLRQLIDAVSHDHMTALSALSNMRLLSAAGDVCRQTLEHNAFLTSVRAVSHEVLILALFRMFDPNTRNAGIAGVCDHAKKHPEECLWLMSPEGQAEYPNGTEEVVRKADDWLARMDRLPFTQAIIVLRHNFVGHRGSKAWLGKAPRISLNWSQISEALLNTDQMVNDFRYFTDNTTVYHKNIYDQVINDGSHTLACAEAHLEMLISDPDRSDRMSEVREAIREADGVQIEQNGWVL